MVYRVIGLMSGSSLDGLDIAYVLLEEKRGNWTFEIAAADCVPYPDTWKQRLQHAAGMHVGDFLKLHTEYGQYLGHLTAQFIAGNGLEHAVQLVASHGHTVFHEPHHRTTFQIGDGAALAAAVGLPVISDLRMMDVALGGQGAPIVPIGDKLLFGEYDYLLNIGGIANLTVNNGGNFTAFDVCPANLVLNLLAAREGLDMDEDGILASSGRCMERVLDALDGQGYYSAAPPKSLSNSQAVELVFPKLLESSHSTADQLLTVVRHIVGQVGKAVASFPVLSVGQPRRMLVTGGGAFNKFLIAQLAALLAEQGVEVVVPDAPTVKFKEALVMALIGVLRWRGEVNVLASVTGARQDSIGGAVWMV